MELDDEFLEMVGKIAKLSLEKSHNKKADIFFDYYPHTHEITIRVYKNGYDYEGKADYRKDLYIRIKDFLRLKDLIFIKQELKEVIETIEKL
nr:MAG TPA: hypothetical protein [Caudoviricetes sp.]